MRQHTTPLIVRGTTSSKLERVNLGSSDLTEDWLQEVIHSSPTLLPVQEIEPAFSNQVAVCRELPTESGFCDNLLINDSGYITIVECKLWRNPESRRKVVAQILDYAKDMTRWSYQKLEDSVLSARGDKTESLVSLIQEYHPDVQEEVFIDQVQKNLRSARFLLLIVGDGIREGTEDIADFLQIHGDLSFSLALLEMPIYRMNDDAFLITPRVLVRTMDIVRSVIRIEDNRTIESIPADRTHAAQTNTEEIFYHRLAESKGTEVSEQTVRFVQSFDAELSLKAQTGRGKRISLNLKSDTYPFNFASIQETGEVWFYGIVTKADELGKRSIGTDYLNSLAEIVGGAVDDTVHEWNWSVKRNGQYIGVEEYLRHATEIKNLIRETLGEIQRHEDSS